MPVDSDTIQAHLMGKRAQILAAVYLTGSPDVRIVESGQDSGPDLTASLLVNGVDDGRLFAVDTKGLLVFWDSVLADLSRNEAERYRKIPFPVALFVFSMSDEKGKWRWLRELVAVGGASLVLRETGEFLPLDDTALEDILTAVRNWYNRIK